MDRHRMPTARFRTCDSADAALAWRDPVSSAFRSC